MIPGRRITIALALTLAPLLLIACGRGSDRSAAPASTTPPASATPAPSGSSSPPPSSGPTAPTPTAGISRPSSSGCGVAPQYGQSSHSLEFAGLERSYRLYVPRSYDPQRPAPLVLNFHGFGSNALEQDLESGMPSKAESAGFILATPQAANDPPRWSVAGSPFLPGVTDDAGFVKDLIGQLSSSLCIDPKRIYATGLSNGAAMASYLGCALNDEIAAIAPVAGSPYSDLCRDKGPMPIVIFHGTGDRVVPFDGNTLGGGIAPVSVPENLRRWAEHNGCDITLKTREVAADVTKDYYDGCAQGADAELYIIHGGGHTWPGSKIPLPLLGKTTKSISATDIMWAFFEAHPKP